MKTKIREIVDVILLTYSIIKVLVKAFFMRKLVSVEPANMEVNMN